MKKTGKRVIAKNKKTGEVRTFKSAKEASRQLGINYKRLARNCYVNQCADMEWDFSYDENTNRITEKQAEVILAMAENGLCATRAGKHLYISSTTVNFHCDAVYTKTGKNPRDFYDMIDLVKLAEKTLWGEKNERSKI